MSHLWLGSCAVALVLMRTQRRDRRFIARAPLAGAALIVSILAGYATWRIFVHPGPVCKADGAFLRAVLAANSGFAMPLVVPWLRALVRQDLPRLARALCARGAWTLSYMLLGLLSAVLYFLYGWQLGTRGVFEHHDALFDADPIYEQLFYGAAIHTHTHPLLPVIWYAGCKTAEVLAGPRWAPLAVNSAFGGVCVLLAALYFRAVTRSGLLALLGALVLACTSAHLVFAALPESWILSAALLIVLQMLVVWRESPMLRLRHAVLACVLASGITITNAGPALVCFLLWHAGRCRRGNIIRWAAYCLVFGSFLFGLQTAVRPDAEPLQPAHYFDEARFVETNVPLPQRVAGLTHGLFVQSVVGWIPAVGVAYGRPVLRAGSAYDTLGLVTVAVWIALSLGAIGVLLQRGVWRRRTFLAAVVCLGLVAGLHSFYGLTNLFLYSCSFTFYVLAILAHSLAGIRGRGVAAILGGFWVLLAVNNARFCARIVTMLDQLGRGSG
jgi:hypothetical protein